MTISDDELLELMIESGSLIQNLRRAYDAGYAEAMHVARYGFLATRKRDEKCECRIDATEPARDCLLHRGA